MDLFNIWQIYFNYVSKANCYPWTHHYYNESCTVYFENSVILDLISKEEHKKAEYFGVMSHLWALKTHMSREWKTLNFETLKESLDGADLISFNRKSTQNNLLEFAETKHPGFKKALKLILDRIGFEYNEKQKTRHIVYSNHFIMKGELYEKYVNEMLKPVIEVTEDESFTELQDIIWKNSGYHKNKSLSLEIKQRIGVNYYPYHPFICERLLSLWLNKHTEINCKHW